MKYNFDEIVDRKGTNSIKWEFAQKSFPNASEDALPLWVADMDFPCPKPVIEALHKRVDRQIFGYSEYKTDEYYSSVCNWMKKHFDIDINPSDIFVSSGVVPAIDYLIKAFTKENEGIIVQKPVYYPFMRNINNNNRKVINNPLINNDGYYTIDFEDLKEKAKDPNNTMMILCSPHNPVGRVWSEEELKKIGQVCLENDVILVSDEIHSDLLRKGIKHTSIAKLFDTDKIITCTAPSKTFNLAGLGVSNIFIRNEEYKQKWSKVVGNKMLNPLSIVAVQAAYSEGEDWLNQVSDYLDNNMKFIKEYLKENLPKAKFQIPEGTYLAWLDLSAYESDGEKLDQIMLEEAKVILDGGTMFGEEGSGYQRINVACPISILENCMNRISKALNK